MLPLHYIAANASRVELEITVLETVVLPITLRAHTLRNSFHKPLFKIDKVPRVELDMRP